MNAFKQAMRNVDEYIFAVIRQREEILEAFLCKYGCQPDEIEQVQQNTPEGIIWSVRQKESKCNL